MHYINICNQTDKELFLKALNRIKSIKGFVIQGEVLEDVDGSLYATFQYEDGQVVLKNDEDIGALFIESDKNIENIIYK